MNDADRLIIQHAENIKFWINTYRGTDDLNQQDADRVLGIADALIKVVDDKYEGLRAHRFNDAE